MFFLLLDLAMVATRRFGGRSKNVLNKEKEKNSVLQLRCGVHQLQSND